MFSKIPRVKLSNLPTPLEPADKLAFHLGLEKLLIKRDDLTGLAFGGNKARKLEFELAQAIAGGYDSVITVGAQQSNHARMTAAAACKLGLDVKLVLGGKDFAEIKGNLLLDTMFGAEIRYINGSNEDEDLATLQHAWRDELAAQGKKPYVLPLGGSTPYGTLGYVKAMEELAGQTGNERVHIFTPVSSCGTLAGVALGASLFIPNAEVTGISVSRKNDEIREITKELQLGAAALLGVSEAFIFEKYNLYDNYFEEYAKPVKIAREAADDCARLEGLIFDQVYTAKAMAGLFDLARTGALRKDVPVIFIHTGGMPEVFSGTLLCEDYPNITKLTPDEVRRLRK